MYHAYLIRILMGYIRYTLLWLYKNVGMGQTSVSLFNLILTVNILTVHHNFCKLTLPGISPLEVCLKEVLTCTLYRNKENRLRTTSPKFSSHVSQVLSPSQCYYSFTGSFLSLVCEEVFLTPEKFLTIQKQKVIFYKTSVFIYNFKVYSCICLDVMMWSTGKY